MLFIVNPSQKTTTPATAQSFADLSLSERHDLQEWVISNPELLGEDLLVVTSEFSGFNRTSERLDVLAVDRSGKLVVVELKRSAVGTSADLQALRYAAYCSTLGLDDVAELYQRHAELRRGQSPSLEEARTEILDFIEKEDFEDFDDRPRVVLAAEQFPTEITATVLWLRTFEVDVSVVRLRPYRVAGQLVIDSTVLIPLPEAEDFIIRRESKEERVREVRKGRGEAYRTWYQPLLDELRDKQGFTNARIAQPQSWYSFASGTTGAQYGVSFTTRGLRVELYIDTQDRERNKAILDRLLQDREAIESECGFPLEWERLEARRASRVGVYRDTRIQAEPEELEEARAWAIEGLLTFKRVFGPRLPKVLG